MNVEEVRQRMAEELVAAGVRRGGVVLVHSSLRALGTVPGGPETVVVALLRAVGPDGTLLMPALSYATVRQDSPVFDARHTPSCVGAVSEHFRTRCGTIRSVHPTHSVCGVGRRAAEMLADHHLDTTPVGPRSPFRRVPDYGGQVLMLGCGLRPNTSIHGVEELVEPPYVFGPTVTYRLIHADGNETAMDCRRHSFVGWKQRYDRAGELLADDGLTSGPVLQATAHVLDAPRLWARALRALRRDPLFFVEPAGDEPRPS